MKTSIKIINTIGADQAEYNIEKYLSEGYALHYYQHDGFFKYHMVFIYKEMEEVKKEEVKENWLIKLLKRLR